MEKDEEHKESPLEYHRKKYCRQIPLIYVKINGYNTLIKSRAP